MATQNKPDAAIEIVDPNAPKTDAAITMTAPAIEHVAKYLTQHSDAIGLRLRVKNSGCSGLTYVIEYAEQKNDDDNIFTMSPAVSVYVDKESLKYLQGTCVDYIKQGLNGRLRCINPNETNACGCGDSFSVE